MVQPKFSKEEWFNLSPEQQIYYRMIFEKEKLFWKKITIISSRILSIFLICVIAWFGYIQLVYVAEVNEIKTEYGKDAYCYLCGLETVKKCDCVYLTPNQMEFYKTSQIDIREEMAKYNAQICSGIEKTIDFYLELNDNLSSNSDNLPSFHLDVGLK